MKIHFLLFLAVLFLVTRSSAAEWASKYPRPRRPERFDTAEQINNYLKELQEYYSVHGRGRLDNIDEISSYLRDLKGYYSVHGRGRYGKRQMHIADASVTFRETPFFENNNINEEMFKALGYK